MKKKKSVDEVVLVPPGNNGIAFCGVDMSSILCVHYIEERLKGQMEGCDVAFW